MNHWQSRIFCSFLRRALCMSFLSLFTSMLFLVNGCGLNPIPAPNVISGSDHLSAPKNGDATFVFEQNGESYGSFQLKAYLTVPASVLQTPQGGGIQKSSDNLNVAPESGYGASEECGYYYYYMITDVAPHYAKVFIHSTTQDDSISIDFNWWLQTQAGERNF